ncbi:fructose-specific PTS transporter subunit EIIC [Streptomyces sp. SDT5-1]|uniref:fructose-specific PTS transporter subunit EIIC n=1 Tax=Streptomyces sp. SDT5-1 TaxID=3406418 RepID=UPI003FD4761A
MTSPADPHAGGGAVEQQRKLKLLAVTSCPTGIAHTYMAAEKLQQAADAAGIDMKVETQGSIGAENVLTDNDVKDADGVIIAADTDVDRSRFAGKRLLAVGVSEGISHPEQLLERVRTAPVHGGSGGGAAQGAAVSGGKDRGAAYKALMNGVSFMIPFVVVGGLLIAVSLAIGGHATPDGIQIPKDTFWFNVNALGTLGFKLMLPIFSGYIAYALGDRPALVPGMIGGFLAADASIYGSDANAGFLGAIVTGFLAGYLVIAIRKVKVPKAVQPIMPIIVVPIVSTLAVGLAFIYILGGPISWVFTHLTDFLGGMTGSSAVLLGALIGLMIAFDMGGPVNKTAFLFAVGLIGTNNAVMGMAAAAIPVMPLGQGLATLIRRKLYSDAEREAGIAALFMGCFGISEGAIPFAAARPAQVIPANMLGGAVAGAIAGLAGVEDSVPHGGPIVAVFGAISGLAMFVVAMAAGTVVTALTTNALIGVSNRRAAAKQAATESGKGAGAPEPALVGAAPAVSAESAPEAHATATVASASASASLQAAAAGSTAAGAAEAEAEAGAESDGGAPEVLSGYLTARTVKVRLDAQDKEAAIRELAGLAAGTGKVADAEELVQTALRREEQGTTGLGEEIAIPHAKTDAVTAPVVAFARSSEGIEWGSLDGTKAKLVFMIAVPEAAAGDEHLRILALLSRKLMDTDFRARLQAAPDEAAILEVLAEVQ